ncbi:MAG: hypothetical protein FJ290_04630 [Planctomycetes bacterium]|nr:hypothetical protein [Planctomycetota bacterium]
MAEDSTQDLLAIAQSMRGQAQDTRRLDDLQRRWVRKVLADKVTRKAFLKVADRHQSEEVRAGFASLRDEILNAIQALRGPLEGTNRKERTWPRLWGTPQLECFTDCEFLEHLAADAQSLVTLSDATGQTAYCVASQVRERLTFWRDAGFGYLTLLAKRAGSGVGKEFYKAMNEATRAIGELTFALFDSTDLNCNECGRWQTANTLIQVYCWTDAAAESEVCSRFRQYTFGEYEDGEPVRLIERNDLKQALEPLNSSAALPGKEVLDGIEGLSKFLLGSRAAGERRVVVGATLAVAGVAAICVLPWGLGWQWLADHPNRLGIYGAAIMVCLGLCWTVAFPKHKTWSLGAVVLGGGLALLTILGR